MASVDTRRDLSVDSLGQIAIGQHEVLSSPSRLTLPDTQRRTPRRDRTTVGVRTEPTAGSKISLRAGQRNCEETSRAGGRLWGRWRGNYG